MIAKVRRRLTSAGSRVSIPPGVVRGGASGATLQGTVPGGCGSNPLRYRGRAAGPIPARRAAASAARSARCSAWPCSARRWSGRPTSAGRCGTTPRPTCWRSITSGASRGSGRPGRSPASGIRSATSIGNTDAIPLVAFPLKLLHARACPIRCSTSAPGCSSATCCRACSARCWCGRSPPTSRCRCWARRCSCRRRRCCTASATPRCAPTGRCWRRSGLPETALHDSPLAPRGMAGRWCAAVAAIQPYLAAMVVPMALAGVVSDGLGRGRGPRVVPSSPGPAPAPSSPSPSSCSG